MIKETFFQVTLLKNSIVSMITPLDGVINTKLDKYMYLFTLLFWIRSNKTRISHV